MEQTTIQEVEEGDIHVMTADAIIKCETCNRPMKNRGYKRCYQCYENEQSTLTNKCQKCGKKIKDDYVLCFKCNEEW